MSRTLHALSARRISFAFGDLNGASRSMVDVRNVFPSFPTLVRVLFRREAERVKDDLNLLHQGPPRLAFPSILRPLTDDSAT